MGRTAFVTLWLCFGISFAAVERAIACSCMENGPPCWTAPATDVVLLGRVLDQKPVDPSNPHNSPRLARISVIEVFKGLPESSTETAVTTAANGAMCGVDLVPGKDYIFYLRHLPGGALEASLCSRTRRIDEAAEDLAYLRGPFRIPPSLGRISGVVRRTGSSSVRPAAGVTLLASGARRATSTITDQLGRFELDVPVGTYQLRLPAITESETVRILDWRERRVQPVEVTDTQGCVALHVLIQSNGR